MPIQNLNFRSSLIYLPPLELNHVKSHGSCYYDLFAAKDQRLKKQIDFGLNFSKMTSFQNLPTALNILGKKDVGMENDRALLDSSIEEVNPIIQIFDPEGRVTTLKSLDGTLNYKIVYGENNTTVINQVTQEVHLQQRDNEGRLIREVFPCGLEMSWKFDGDGLAEVTLPDQSKVVYQYLDKNHINIQRLSSSGEAQYLHTYEAENETHIKEVLICKTGSLKRQYDAKSKTLISESDYLCVIDQYDEDQNLISRILKDLTEKKAFISLNYPGGNLLAGEKRHLDDQGRVIHYEGFRCSYDEKGRLIQKVSSDQTIGYKYDALDRLISVELGNKKVEYTHDILGRRLCKIVTENGETHKEFYLYQGVNQTGVYNENKELIHQRILGVAFHKHLPFAIAIESQGQVYAPIYSSNYNILQLINKDTGETIHYESLSPFGENLQDLNPVCPWIFATKHCDSETGLIDFGDRQYDPSIKQWTSADADPRATEEDLYSYCNNNPLKYIDPNGQWRINFSFVIPLGLGALRGVGPGAAGGPLGILLGVVAGAAIGLTVDTVQKKINEDRMKENGRPNKQFEHAVADVEKKLGRKLNQKEIDRFHDLVTGQGYGYHEMVDEGFHFFDDRYKK